MPILNAFSSVWDTVKFVIPVPTEGTPRLSLSGESCTLIANSFSIKEVATLDFDASVMKGSPVGTMWSVGDSVWQVDFSTPFLMWDPVYFSNNNLSSESYSIPLCANLPVKDGYAHTTRQFIRSATMFLLGSYSSPINRSLLSEHWSNEDYVVQRVSIDVSENSSLLSVSILSTVDPRTYFHVDQTQMITSPGPLRVAKPWDFSIPQDPYVLGSPSVRYDGGHETTPTRHLWVGDPSNRSMVVEWSVSIESQITRFKSVGTPSGRPMLGISSQRCDGRLKYIPVHVDAGGSINISDTSSSNRLPVGWRVDSQSMDTIGRYGGQMYISGNPPYTTGINPVFVEIKLRDGTSNTSGYYVISKEMLGPIGVVDVGIEASSGGRNLVAMSYKTALGIDVAGDDFVYRVSGSDTSVESTL